MISAIILAAGESRRMGEPKMLLPWGAETVIGHVVSAFCNAGIQDVLVVTGGARKQVEELLRGRPKVRTIPNPDYAEGEMLSSIQCGLAAQRPESRAALIGLGDQPQVRESIVRLVCETFVESGAQLVVPSFQMRRGHPWLIARPLWSELGSLSRPQTARDFLNAHSAEIAYAVSASPSVIEDLDTPDDFEKYEKGNT